ncbi:hypothetical protein P9E76_11945 [Schinkia azotoformans]|uniref:Sugar O-acyltransferase, sialic acid O-acetyltransferase NeuD family protein n=1 Tax=Schinkia azotoformans LMG 9581 TaxID=1131731 RepID=K6DPS5_SCHAZ|nr:hypothetical protein [Schinkia azotoformans]EKN62791.1 sugar O-acyltransferase, sialic acid O-acetyltransferase NeuD family protein [Schinkia azotoformans LMG 9581]MEC1639166.1 hypothetical protein [Schinkia azotoformans]MEC1945754.1 hypothetical protein [Schinkia azotoformans]
MENVWKGLPFVIFGVGGQAKEIKVLIDDINQSNKTPVYEIIGFVSNSQDDVGLEIEGIKVVSTNDNFPEFSKKYKLLGATIALANPKWKEQIVNSVFSKTDNIVFPNLIHPYAHVSTNANNELGIGNIICAGVTITTNIKLGKFIILNYNSTVGHDVVIEDYCTINPLSAISGNIKLSKGSLVGAGSSIREKLTVGEYSTVGLGSTVVKNVDDNKIVIGKAAENLEYKRRV